MHAATATARARRIAPYRTARRYIYLKYRPPPLLFSL
jgi:hypothetical protein